MISSLAGHLLSVTLILCGVLKSVIVFDKAAVSSNFRLCFNSLLLKADFCLVFSNSCLYLSLESLQ